MDNFNWRQKNMLQAGLACFLKNGIRGTSMEMVAQQANVAKPTLYKYFPDKAVLFNAVVDFFFATVRAQISELLEAEAGGEKSAAELLGSILILKHEAVDHVLSGSAHVDEVFSAYSSGAVSAFGDMDDWVQSHVSNILADAGHLRPDYLAGILLASVSGLFKRNGLVSDWKDATRFLVDRLLGDLPDQG